MTNKFPDYDFLGSVYLGTKGNELEESLLSIKLQTLKPKNIIIIIDGFIKKEVKTIIDKYSFYLPIKTIPIKQNVGLGLALRKGLKECKSKIVLRFDTDDINVKERALVQVKEITESNIDIVGSNIYEFNDNKEKIINQKVMPLSHNNIKKSIIFRNPINHPSAGFLKDSIIKLDGGYRDFPFYEDYDLWIRAIFSGLKFKNINKNLVGMRVSDQRSRRTGFKLIFMELRLLKTFFQYSKLHGILFIPILFLRSIFKILPLKIVIFLFEKILRKKIK